MPWVLNEAKEKTLLATQRYRGRLRSSNTNSHIHTGGLDIQIHRATYACSHALMHTYTQEEIPDGQTDAKKIFRYTDLHTFTDTYLNKSVDMHTQAHTPFKDCFIPKSLHVSYD